MSEPLLILSRAVADMGREPDQVPAIAVRAAMELGYDGACFRVLEDGQMTHRPLESVGTLGDAADRHSLSAGMADLVLQRGGTVVATRVPSAAEVPLP